jgi:nucleoside-diphosphate-sugar epimerase
VVGALIRKFVEAVIEEEDEVECWGTGAPMREFMYVDDAGEAVVQALEKYDDSSTPLNIGTGNDISIKELVDYIVSAVENEKAIRYFKNERNNQLGTNIR